MRPAILADAGAGTGRSDAGRALGLPRRAVHRPDRRLDPAVESAAYFVVAESLVNVVRHASATVARVAISTETDPDRIVVAVTDDGVGGASVARGSGIRGLKDRVEALGGQLAGRESRGQDSISVELPCAL